MQMSELGNVKMRKCEDVEMKQPDANVEVWR